MSPGFSKWVSLTVVGANISTPIWSHLDAAPAEARGAAAADPFRDLHDHAENRFAIAVAARDTAKIVAAWNEFLDLDADISAGFLNVAVTLLATVVNETEMPAAEVIRLSLGASEHPG